MHDALIDVIRADLHGEAKRLLKKGTKASELYLYRT